MSKGYEVTLEGTWSRPNTWPSDITMLRQLSYWIRREAIRTGVPAIVQFSIKAKQAKAGRELTTREGTFVAAVRVDDIVAYPRFSKKSKVPRRAKDILRWFLEDVCCTPPKIKFDNSKTWIRSYS